MILISIIITECIVFKIQNLDIRLHALPKNLIKDIPDVSFIEICFRITLFQYIGAFSHEIKFILYSYVFGHVVEYISLLIVKECILYKENFDENRKIIRNRVYDSINYENLNKCEQRIDKLNYFNHNITEKIRSASSQNSKSLKADPSSIQTISLKSSSSIAKTLRFIILNLTPLIVKTTFIIIQLLTLSLKNNKKVKNNSGDNKYIEKAIFSDSYIMLIGLAAVDIILTTGIVYFSMIPRSILRLKLNKNRIKINSLISNSIINKDFNLIMNNNDNILKLQFQYRHYKRYLYLLILMEHVTKIFVYVVCSTVTYLAIICSQDVKVKRLFRNVEGICRDVVGAYEKIKGYERDGMMLMDVLKDNLKEVNKENNIVTGDNNLGVKDKSCFINGLYRSGDTSFDKITSYNKITLTDFKKIILTCENQFRKRSERKNLENNIEITCLKIKNLRIDLNAVKIKVDELKFRIGERVLIIGSNGSGKTSFVKGILGLRKSGDVFLENGCGECLSLDEYNPTEIFSYIPQDLNFDDESVLKTIFKFSGMSDKEILEIVGLSDNTFNGEYKENYSDRKKIIQKYQNLLFGDELHDDLEISHLLLKKEHEIKYLSRGERSKINILRGILKKFVIIVADEPLASLDEKSRKVVIKRLFEASRDKFLFLVSHEMISGFDRVLNINEFRCT